MQDKVVLRNRYEILRKIGECSIGYTYLAKDLESPWDNLCAVRQLKANDINRDAKVLLEREAQTLYKLRDYSQIPKFIAYFEENDNSFLVREFINGHDLTEELIREKRLSQDRTIKLLKELLEVLIVLHSNNIIHQNLKPSNVVRRQSDGKITLTDLGAVVDIKSKPMDSRLRFRPLDYIPQEQAHGNPQFSSNVYSVGIIAIQALTGFNRANIERDSSTSKFLWRQYTPHVRSDLADIIDKMTNVNYSQRYYNAQESLKVIEKLTTTTTIISPHSYENHTSFTTSVAKDLDSSVHNSYVIKESPKIKKQNKINNIFDCGEHLIIMAFGGGFLGNLFVDSYIGTIIGSVIGILIGVIYLRFEF